jgi:peptidoglycan LD-endopeptidase CwlK
MAQFSQSSKDKLFKAHVDFQILFNYVIQFYDCTIAESYRTKERQHQMVLEGKSKVDYPTVHNTKPSLAVDVYPYEGDHIDYGKTQSAYFDGCVMGVAAMLFRRGEMRHRIRCGIDWNMDSDVDDTSFWDGGHFEIIPNPGETFNYYET